MEFDQDDGDDTEATDDEKENSGQYLTISPYRADSRNKSHRIQKSAKFIWPVPDISNTNPGSSEGDENFAEFEVEQVFESMSETEGEFLTLKYFCQKLAKYKKL